MSLRIAVTGCKGQVGRAVVKRLGSSHEMIGLGREQMDLADVESVRSALTGFEWDLIVHCGAYTQVDKAELEREECRRINVEATRQIAEIAGRRDRAMIYLSTDYVFDGKKTEPYEIDDTPNPINYYGVTKLEGELVVEKLVPRHQIVRTSWVFGANGPNFVLTMLRLGRERDVLRVISDQVGSPTYSVDVAELIAEMVLSGRTGTFHATSEGFCSWFELAEAIAEKAGFGAKVEPISTDDYPARANRPRNSRLSKRSLDEAGFRRLPHWTDALHRYLMEIGEAKG
jgi:dTDP-4-dehydrorhamnose reductase